MTTRLDFALLACRAEFRAAGQLRFPAQAANALRGALGFALDPAVFSPCLAAGPSGLKNPPRPFVLHASHLNGALIGPGERFEFELAVFSQDAGPYHSALGALQSIVRAPVSLGRFEASPVVLDLEALEAAPERIRVRFLTPTELKGEESGGAPGFKVLMARVRDRLSALRSLYGQGPPPIDFRRFLEAAADVRLLRAELAPTSGARRSSRTGQIHPLGGFTGFAEYEGDFRSYLPWLEAAGYACVGRQTVWGHGRLAVEPL